MHNAHTTLHPGRHGHAASAGDAGNSVPFSSDLEFAALVNGLAGSVDPRICCI